MPLLEGREHQPSQAVARRATDEVLMVRFTGEVFEDYG